MAGSLPKGLRVRRAPLRAVDGAVLAQWATLHSRADASPFFSPAFVAACDRHLAPVELVTVSAGSTVVAVWPLQSRRMGMAEPVAFGLSDAQGWLVDTTPRLADDQLDPAAVLRRAGFATYDFDHLVDPHGHFARWCDGGWPSPTVDVSDGFDAYMDRLGGRGSSLAKRVRYLERRLGREVGPVTFDHDTSSVDPMWELLRHKREQYKRTGRPDVLASGSRQKLLACLAASDDTQSRGALSTLSAGGRPIAWHLGMRSGTILHYWFPAYDPDFGRYSPGLLLLMRTIAAECESPHTKVIDLGTGDSAYKRRVATGANILWRGAVAGMPGAIEGRRTIQAVRSATRAGGSLHASAVQLRDTIEAPVFRALVSVDTQEPVVAATYDDGPDPATSARIGQMWAESGHSLTFFVLVSRARQHRSTILELLDQGHQVELHGLDHTRLSILGGPSVTGLLGSAKAQLEYLTGRQVQYLRPPYGSQTRTTFTATRLAGLAPVGWSLDSRDYSLASAQEVADGIRSEVKPGDVVLLHDADGERPSSTEPSYAAAHRTEVARRLIGALADQGLASMCLSDVVALGTPIRVRWLRGPQ